MRAVWKNIFVSFFALLCFGLGWAQNFSLTGNVITQTGTNTDLSGLSGITGVTHSVSGDYNIYDLGTLKLEIQGTLYHDPEKEVLIFNGSDDLSDTTPVITVKSSGTYTYGKKETSGNKVKYSSGTGLIDSSSLTGVKHEWEASSHGLIYNEGGTVNMYGGVVLSRRAIGMGESVLGTNPTVNIEKTVFKKPDSETAIRELRFDAGEGDSVLGSFDGIIDGFRLTHRALPNDFSATLINSQIVQLARGPEHVTLRDIDTSNNFGDFDFGTDNLHTYNGSNNIGDIAKTYTIINASEGSGLRLMPKYSDLRQPGILIVKKELRLLLTNVNGTSVEGIVVYITDTDNGYRKNANSLDSTSDKTYTQLTDSNGEAFLEVTTAITNIETNSSITDYNDWDTTNHSNNFKVDRRGKDDTTNDLFDVHLYGYEYSYLEFEESLKGLGVLESQRVLLTDTNISQTDKTIVDAYTEIDDLDKIYDRAKSWKVDNVADEYPAIDSQLISVTGNTLDLGSQNLVVDANASQTFAVDTSTNTITIKANPLITGSKFSSITTTGNISAQNGAEIFLGYEDSIGKNIFVNFNWGTNDTYHVNIVNLNNNSVIATHNSQTSNYRGTFIAPNPFGSGVKVQLLNTGDNSVFYEANFADENALIFTRDSGSITDISTETSGSAQHEALFLARKILQKTESMAAALEGTTPTLADDRTTITEANSSIATKENQLAIRALLLRILTKTSASYEALKGAE